MSTNLALLARIARGERSFRPPTAAQPDEEAAFHQLVADARHLAAAGYIPSLRRSGEWSIAAEHALDIQAPGITPAGIARLREAGLLAPVISAPARRRGGDE